jgi:hypothetical protein
MHPSTLINPSPTGSHHALRASGRRGLLLPGRLHLRLPDRAGRPGRPLRRVPEAGRRDLLASPPTPTSRTRPGTTASETIGKINYPMIGDPTGTITRNFGVMIEEAGLAERGTFVIDPRARSRSSRSTPAASAATPPSCCARSRPPSTSPATRARSARPSGRKAKPPWRRRWTWSARSFPCPVITVRMWCRPSI